MIKYFLIIIGLILLIANVSFPQSGKTILEYNEKTTLADTDEFVISEADTDYYKHSFAHLKAGILGMSGTWSGNHIFSNTITGSISGNAGTVTNGLYKAGSNTTTSGASYNYVNADIGFDGNSTVSVYGELLGIAGSSWLLPTSMPTTYGLIGRAGSDGSGVVVFNYGTGLKDTLASQLYLRNTMPRWASNNIWSGTNTFNGAVTCSSTTNFYGAINTYASTIFLNATSILDVNGRLNIPALTTSNAYDFGLDYETADRLEFNYAAGQRDTVLSTKILRNEWNDVKPKLSYQVLTISGGTVSIAANSPLLVVDGFNESVSTITSITGGVTGKRITILCKPDDADGFILQDNSNIHLHNSANITMGAGDVVELIAYGTGWFQVAPYSNN